MITDNEWSDLEAKLAECTSKNKWSSNLISAQGLQRTDSDVKSRLRGSFTNWASESWAIS